MPANVRTDYRSPYQEVGSWLKQLVTVPWPFTFPLTDVLLYLVLLPVFWVMGLEQFLPVLWFALAIVKLLLIQPKIRVPLPARLAVPFLMWQWVSATSIDAGDNWFVFVKNFATYLVGILVFVLIVNTVKTRRHFNQVVAALMLLSFVVSVIAVGYFVGLLPDSFPSLAGGLLPGFITRSNFIQDSVVLREVGEQTVMWGVPFQRRGIPLRRASSIFLYSATASQFYLFILPLQALLVLRSKGWSRVALILLLLLSVFVLLLTTTRMPILALTAAVPVVLGIRHLVRSQPREKRVRLGYVLIASTLISTVVVGFFFLNMIGGGALESLLRRGRPGSYELRSQIYRVTMESWKERPLIGWGTQRRLPELPPDKAPAGTHSEYMAYLYRFGLIGLFLHLGVYGGLWSSLIPCWFSGGGRKDKDAFLTTFAITLFAVHFNGIVHAYDWDATLPVILWTVVGLSYWFCSTREDSEDSQGLGVTEV